MKKLTLYFGVLCIFFGINAYIFNHKIKKINVRLNRITDQSVCLGQAKSIASEIFYEHAKKKIDSLRKGLDTKSNEVLDYVLRSMQYENYFKGLCWEKFEIAFPTYQYEHEQHWLSEKPQIMKKYNIRSDYICPEVFYFHHGLRFADQKILDYIKDKDIIDCGAFIGDSVLVLRNYTNKTIYCYEFSKPNIRDFEALMRANNISSGYKIIPNALGDKIYKICINNSNETNSAEQLVASGNGNENGYIVDVTTIDEDIKKYGFKIGLIKMDVEGAGMQVIRGG